MSFLDFVRSFVGGRSVSAFLPPKRSWWWRVTRSSSLSVKQSFFPIPPSWKERERFRRRPSAFWRFQSNVLFQLLVLYYTTKDVFLSHFYEVLLNGEGLEPRWGVNRVELRLVRKPLSSSSSSFCPSHLVHLGGSSFDWKLWPLFFPISSSSSSSSWDIISYFYPSTLEILNIGKWSSTCAPFSIRLSDLFLFRSPEGRPWLGGCSGIKIMQIWHSWVDENNVLKSTSTI